VYGVGEVSAEASRNVPAAIAAANAINKTAVKRVEKRTEDIFLSMKTIFCKFK